MSSSKCFYVPLSSCMCVPLSVCLPECVCLSATNLADLSLETRRHANQETRICRWWWLDRPVYTRMRSFADNLDVAIVVVLCIRVQFPGRLPLYICQTRRRPLRMRYEHARQRLRLLVSLRREKGKEENIVCSSALENIMRSWMV